jgi:hypothetical protein
LTVLDKILDEKGLAPVEGGLVNKNNTSGDALANIVT